MLLGSPALGFGLDKDFEHPSGRVVGIQEFSLAFYYTNLSFANRLESVLRSFACSFTLGCRIDWIHLVNLPIQPEQVIRNRMSYSHLKCFSFNLVISKD